MLFRFRRCGRALEGRRHVHEATLSRATQAGAPPPGGRYPARRQISRPEALIPPVCNNESDRPWDSLRSYSFFRLFISQANAFAVRRSASLK